MPHLDALQEIADILESQSEDRVKAYVFADKLMFNRDNLTPQEVIAGLYHIQETVLNGSGLAGTVQALIDIEKRKQPKKKSFFRRK